jgi:uncharacterized membrane protein
LILEKENTTVRFHAVQSIVVFGAFTVIEVVLRIIPVIGVILTSILGLGALILWILLMYKTYKGEKWVLPIAGKIAEQNSKPAAK